MKLKSETEKEYKQILAKLAKKNGVKVQDIRNTISNMDSILANCFVLDRKYQIY
jgi:hypothetical protein